MHYQSSRWTFNDLPTWHKHAHNEYWVYIGHSDTLHCSIFNCLFAWRSHKRTEYWFIYWLFRYIALLNIWLPVRLMVTYTQWTLVYVSAGPIHSITKYSMAGPPDGHIHTMNISLGIRRSDTFHCQIFNCLSAWRSHTHNEYQFIYRPVRYIPLPNIQWPVRLTPAYSHWIFGR
jgi:hypothetical protein